MPFIPGPHVFAGVGYGFADAALDAVSAERPVADHAGHVRVQPGVIPAATNRNDPHVATGHNDERRTWGR